MTPFDRWLVREQWLGHEVKALEYYLRCIHEALEEMDKVAAAHAANGRWEQAAAWQAAHAILAKRVGRLPSWGSSPARRR